MQEGSPPDSVLQPVSPDGDQGMLPTSPSPAPLDAAAGVAGECEAGSEEGGSPAMGIARGQGLPGADIGRGPDVAAKYREQRRRKAAAKRRGPFIRDTATESELPARARSAAYRILNSEISDDTISAHHLITFRKYVDSLIDGVKEAPEGDKLHSDEKDLGDAAKGPWWDLPRVETWLKERIKTWAVPLKELSPSPTPINRFCHVTAYGAKGTRQQMEDYHCSYLHWGNYFGGPTTSCDIPVTERDERELDDSLRKTGLSSEEKAQYLSEWKGRNTSRFLGVFDGHGGMDCAAYARDLLPQEIIESEHFPHDIEQACITSFKNINKSFITRAFQAECDAGTTALVTFMWESRLYVASVGDCAAVIARKGQAGEMITHPHTAANPAEAAAVEQRGGIIRNMGGNLRVDGVVSVTRGLGCKQCTAHTSCIPDVTAMDLTPEDEFLLLASDGLWDVMTPAEASDAVRSLKAELDAASSSDPSKPRYEPLASRLAAEAIAKGSADNVTIVVAIFEN